MSPIPAGRMANEVSRHPIKIMIDHNQMKAYNNHFPEDEARTNFLLGVVLDARRYFEETLTVVDDGFVNYSGTLTGSFYKNHDWITGPYEKEKGDLVIKLIFERFKSEVIAAGQTLSRSSYNDRPKVGVLYLDATKVKDTSADSHNLLFTTILQEMMRILAFSKENFDKFRRRKKGAMTTEPYRENEVTAKFIFLSAERLSLLTPGILRFAKKFFACNDIGGVPLNKKGPKEFRYESFDMRYFPNELMTPVPNPPQRISKFTLMLLHDSGWYDVNEEMQADYETGRDYGCDFFNVLYQPRSEGFCSTKRTRRTEVCSADFKVGGLCKANNFTGKRKIIVHQPEKYCQNPRVGSDEYIRSIESKGVGSRCWKSAQKRLERYIKKKNRFMTHCLESKCVDGAPVFTVAGEDYTCETEGQRIKFNAKILQGGVKEMNDKLTTTVICPNASKFCQSLKNSCERDCGGNQGYCLKDNKCFKYDLSKTVDPQEQQNRQLQQLMAKYLTPSNFGHRYRASFRNRLRYW